MKVFFGLMAFHILLNHSDIKSIVIKRIFLSEKSYQNLSRHPGPNKTFHVVHIIIKKYNKVQLLCQSNDNTRWICIWPVTLINVWYNVTGKLKALVDRYKISYFLFHHYKFREKSCWSFVALERASSCENNR